MISLDACILIYALEDRGEAGDRVRQALARTDDRIAVSPLVLHECLIKPLRDGDLETRSRLLSAYARMVHLELDETVFLHAAELRARHGLKTPDALHLAAAQLSGCREFWTNDARLVTASRGLAVDVVSA